MKNTLFQFTLLFFAYSSLFAQQERPYQIKFTNEPITIDGQADEAVWEQANVASDFWQWRPTDTIKGQQQTQFKMLANDKSLFILIKAFHGENTFVTNSLKRDFSGYGTDHVTMNFDTFSDATNAFLFAVDPYAVQAEALISNGNNNYRNDRNYAWDIKWESESIKTDTYYQVEMKLPLNFINFPSGSKRWRFNMYRNNSQINEYTTWTRVPQNQSVGVLAYMREIEFEKPLGESRRPVSVIPYLNGLQSRDFTISQNQSKFGVGGDAKVPIGNGLNLDLTLNPDFSQVEVDDQVINLTRFEISLPEKRQFFTQNSDLFSNFGEERDALPFFSRRIGVAKDADGNTIENRIIAGARLSGKLNENLRLGFLNMQTDADPENEIASFNNTVLTLQQKVFTRSNISMILINRVTNDAYDFLEEGETQNRVAGLEYNLASPDNVWTGRAFIHKSDTPGKGDENLSGGFNLSRNTRNHRLQMSSVYVGEDFSSQLGFYRRTGFVKWGPAYTYRSFPKNPKVISREFSQRLFAVFNEAKNNELSDRWWISNYNIRYTNQSNFELRTISRYEYIFDSFDPTRSGNGLDLPGGTDYRFTEVHATYRSDPRKRFRYELEYSGGSFYNGTKYSFSNEFTFRKQPFVNASLRVNYDRIRLPEPYSSADLWLVVPKVEMTFNKTLFWTSLVQFSSQSENLGINSRLQWRFAPLSDLYVVYNDNYFTYDRLTPRLRSINLKLTYWINI